MRSAVDIFSKQKRALSFSGLFSDGYFAVARYGALMGFEPNQKKGYCILCILYGVGLTPHILCFRVRGG